MIRYLDLTVEKSKDSTLEVIDRIMFFGYVALSNYTKRYILDR